MIITAIDPGTRNAGIVTIVLRPDKCRLIISTWQKRRFRETESEYLLTLRDNIDWQIKNFPVDLIAYEAAHLRKSYKSYSALVKALSTVEQCATVAGIPCAWAQPAQWKKAVTGDGNADYNTIRMMLIAMFEESDKPILQKMSEHELAAIGIAIAAGRAEETRRKIEAAGNKEGKAK